jgi:zinc protease
MHRFRTCLVVALLLIAPPVSPASDLRPPALQISTHRLGNGLQVVLLEDHSAPVANVQVWYHVGSKDEAPGRAGFAHLFEHIMFKGSANVAPEEHGRLIQDVGGTMNAYTTYDQTVYWETVPVNALDLALWLEADRMRSLTVDEKNLASETKVVLEEMRLRIENPPFGRLPKYVFESAYKVHPYSRLPIGTREDLEAATLADVQAFHATYYVPNNATLVVVGDFQTASLLATIRRYFGSIPAGPGSLPRPARPEPPQTAERVATYSDPNFPLPVSVMAFHIPERGHPDSYPLQVAGQILSGGKSSRLYESIVYEKQLALQAAGDTLLLENPGLFFFFAILKSTTTPEEVEAEFVAAIERLQQAPLTDDELNKVRTQLVAGVTIQRQTVQEKGSAIGAAAVLLGNPALVNDELARFQAVTAADVQRVAKKYFTRENRTVIRMLPQPAEQSR